MTIEPIGVETVASPAGGQAAAADGNTFNAAIDALLGGPNAKAAASEPADDAGENADADAAVLLAMLLAQQQPDPNAVTPGNGAPGGNLPDGEVPGDDTGANPINAAPNAPPTDVAVPDQTAPPMESAPGWPVDPVPPVLEVRPTEPDTNVPAPVLSNTRPVPPAGPATPAPIDELPEAPPMPEPPVFEPTSPAPSPVAGPNQPSGVDQAPNEPVASPNAGARPPAVPEAVAPSQPNQANTHANDGERAGDPPPDPSRALPVAQAAASTDFSPGQSAVDAPAPPEPAAAQPPAPNTVMAAPAPQTVNEPVPALAAQAAARAFAPPAEQDDVVTPQLVRAMRLQVNGGVGEARVQLEPRHLGAVSIALRVENGLVQAVVTAEQAGVRQWLEAHESSLRQSLAEQGLLLERLQVQRDGESPFDRSRRDQDQPARRRLLRRDNATFELVA